ncbi:hypothetical protein N7462_006057 [Penicillium macrosclerotiorum]|uniref:uncharacterized protein n=1 Tax=Penicillium macrosclerotiorum TaxID=303699 RepID=UPI0025482B52|nr:uncharacterized protein N7462_006057 [Penicillium macrosclerotiorum]KAJ5682892.1 hypothetical protein N7462_006057 [Penicillium macrosclerotiorum]
MAMPSKDLVSEAVELYFQFCHKQPLWLFDSDNLCFLEDCRHEVIFGILSLALRYSNNQSLRGNIDQLCRQYADAAHNLIMMRISHGNVHLSTMQSLCLIALAEYIANDTHLAWVHMGLVTSLAKSGEIDIELHEGEITPTLEARRRLFWSIHFLSQQYGPRSMQVNMLGDIHSPKYMAINFDSSREMGVQPPQIPQEIDCFTTKSGIWNYMVQLASLWNEAQYYVSYCASGDLTPPWSVESGYSIIGAHLMDIETKFPTSHRYDSMRFQEQAVEDLYRDRSYWSPWLYLQFTYHAIHCILNHPFLYSWRPQQSSQLAVPNTFWKTSSELALIHTTWIARLIEMITEKEYQLSDPFLGHTVAVAASIQIYYCRAADSAVRESAQRMVETCMKFLSKLAANMPRCHAIVSPLRNIFKRTVDMSDGGQALPPYSSTVNSHFATENLESQHLDQSNTVSIETSANQVPMQRDAFPWSGSGFQSNMSFMDITRDPFYQFQDHENPYLGIWQIGNL